ncbi:PTS sugar transporter subunit IIA [Desulfoplanes sp.]
MIGIVLVTHGGLGEILIETAGSIVGEPPYCSSVAIDVSRGMDTILAETKEAVTACDQGDGVLILTDMFGGTPTNISLSLLGSGQLEVVTGVNLPMLLKVLGTRGGELQKLASEAKSAGKQGILVAGEVLRRRVEK